MLVRQKGVWLEAMFFLSLLVLLCPALAYPPSPPATLDEALRDWNQVFVDTFKEGDDLLARGDYAGAVERYDRCLAIAPGNPNALNNKAVAVLGTGDGPGALALLDGVIAGGERYPAYARGEVLWRARVNRASALLAAGRHGEAEGLLLALGDERPGDGAVESGLAEARARAPGAGLDRLVVPGPGPAAGATAWAPIAAGTLALLALLLASLRILSTGGERT